MSNNQRLSNEELAQIKERAEKATEGPWRVGQVANEVISASRPRRKPIITRPDADGLNDASFIAHARTDIPKLIAEVEYMREKQAELLEYNRQYFAEIKRLRAEVTRLEMEALRWRTISG